MLALGRALASPSGVRRGPLTLSGAARLSRSAAFAVFSRLRHGRVCASLAPFADANFAPHAWQRWVRDRRSTWAMVLDHHHGTGDSPSGGGRTPRCRYRVTMCGDHPKRSTSCDDRSRAGVRCTVPSWTHRRSRVEGTSRVVAMLSRSAPSRHSRSASSAMSLPAARGSGHPSRAIATRCSGASYSSASSPIDLPCSRPSRHAGTSSSHGVSRAGTPVDRREDRLLGSMPMSAAIAATLSPFARLAMASTSSGGSGGLAGRLAFHAATCWTVGSSGIPARTNAPCQRGAIASQSV